MIANDITVKAIKYADYIRDKVSVIVEQYNIFVEKSSILLVEQKNHLQ